MARCENISSRNKVYESRARNVADARGCEVKVEGSGETAEWIRKAGKEYRSRGREDAGDVSAVMLSFLNWSCRRVPWIGSSFGSSFHPVSLP